MYVCAYIYVYTEEGVANRKVMLDPASQSRFICFRVLLYIGRYTWGKKLTLAALKDQEKKKSKCHSNIHHRKDNHATESVE